MPDAMTTATQALAAAGKTLGDLERKHAAAEQRKAKIAEERAALAYAAHGAGDPKARKRLAALTGESRDIERELEDLGAAIVEARRRVTTAEAEAAAQARRAVEQRIREAGALLGKEAAEVDARLRECAVAILAARGTATEVTRLAGDLAKAGGRLPFNARLLELAIGRAHSAHLQQALRGVAEIALLPPAQRRPLVAQVAPVIESLKHFGTGAQPKPAPAARVREPIDAAAAAHVRAQAVSDRDAHEEERGTIQ